MSDGTCPCFLGSVRISLCENVHSEMQTISKRMAINGNFASFWPMSLLFFYLCAHIFWMSANVMADMGQDGRENGIGHNLKIK